MWGSQRSRRLWGCSLLRTSVPDPNSNSLTNARLTAREGRKRSTVQIRIDAHFRSNFIHQNPEILGKEAFELPYLVSLSFQSISCISL